MTAAQAQQPAVQQPATPTATLPNGASSVNETFGDWTVDCRIVERRKQSLSRHGHSVISANRVFMFAEEDHAETFRARFGGERMHPSERGNGTRWARWTKGKAIKRL
jgi:hypothetical protein